MFCRMIVRNADAGMLIDLATSGRSQAGVNLLHNW